MAGAFEGKRALVLGVANKRSIAWAIAQVLADGGAKLAFTYQGDRIEKGVRDLAGTVDTALVTSCDVRSDDDVARVFARGGRARSAASSTSSSTRSRSRRPRISKGRFTDTPRDRFWLAVDVSAYSLVACTRAAEPLMEKAGGGSIVTMTYLGGERAVPHYNVMGVAKATLDASVQVPRVGSRARRTSASTPSPPGPCARSPRARSPASRRWRRSSRSARRSAATSTPTTSARRRAYLLSDAAKNVTATTLYVDSGYHAMGM